MPRLGYNWEPHFDTIKDLHLQGLGAQAILNKLKRDNDGIQGERLTL